jgi:alkanesulfonate monooxygenase SsuD/methylene tetrahydromethanopterin reductase-like flavin-dependent oxidoreductase (luciferase family)
MEPTSSGVERSRATVRGVGLAVAAPLEVIVTAARLAETCGYKSFWLNNPPGTHALTALAKAASGTSAIKLGVGVIPLAAHRPAEIVRETRENDLPLARLYLGIGSGAGLGGVERVAEGIRAIRSAFRCYVVVAALGPRMCRLAGAEADGVLFNWLTPHFAHQATRWVREGADGAGRPIPRLMAYVRVALGDDAVIRLQREAEAYEAIPQYAAHFRRMGVAALDTAVTGGNPEDIQNGLATWDGVVDEVVVRVITAQDDEAEVSRLLEAAKPSH